MNIQSHHCRTFCGFLDMTVSGWIQSKEKVKELIEQFQSGKLDAQPGRTMMESFEHKVNEVLNKARDNAGKTAQSSLKYTNNVVRMVTAGSKGSFINISQVCRQ